MSEQPERITEAELDKALVELGPHIAYPPTPKLAPAVRSRLMEHPGPRRTPFVALRWGLVAVPFVLLLLMSAVLLLSSSARTALADRLGLRGVAITHVPSVPATSATQAATPGATNLRLGERLSLRDAQAEVPYRILVPDAPQAGSPDEVYLSEEIPGGIVSLVYHARSGLPQTAETGVGILLSQFRGTLAPDIVGKGIGPETRLEPLTVNGGRGFWIEGWPHTFFYRDASGQVRGESVRLAGNTLLWEQGELTLRLESALPKEEALRIAASIR